MGVGTHSFMFAQAFRRDLNRNTDRISFMDLISISLILHEIFSKDPRLISMSMSRFIVIYCSFDEHMRINAGDKLSMHILHSFLEFSEKIQSGI